jgi:hypothetical protein
MLAMEPRVTKVASRKATRMAAGTTIQSLRKNFILQPYMLPAWLENPGALIWDAVVRMQEGTLLLVTEI